MTIAIGRSTRGVNQVSSGSALAQGASGQLVTTLQAMLVKAGFNPQGVDGEFGPLTEAAVRRFQASQGLVRDGMVGASTWAALSAVNATGQKPRAIRAGDAGADVQTLQSMLSRAGFDPNGVDGHFGPDTRSAVTAFQREANLDIDGVVGTNTWRALNETASGPSPSSPRPPVVAAPSSPRPPVVAAPSAPVSPAPAGGPAPAPRENVVRVATPRGAGSDFREKLLEVARGQIGTREATDHNDGAVTKYPAAFGRGTEKWCADFTSWVSHQAGGTMNEPYTPNVVKELKNQGLWKGKANPEPGDLVLFDWNHDKVPDHIGLVETVNDDGTIGTIEGNTDNPDTGIDGVWRRERNLSTVLGFGSPF